MTRTIRIRDKDLEHKAFVTRSLALYGMALALALVLVLRMFQLQVWQHDAYKTRSDENRIKTQWLAPTRGTIYDRKGHPLAENRPVFSLTLVRERIDDLDTFLVELGELLTISTAELESFHERLKHRRRPFEAVPLKRSLTEEEIAVLAVNRHRFIGAEVQARSTRFYPHGQLLAHPVGSVRRISEDDLQQLDPVRYAATQHIGRRGVEQFYESALHGNVGKRVVETNAHGRVLRELDNDSLPAAFESIPPQPGQNITLYLDKNLQITAAAALSGHSRGAIVALDTQSGGILAMVSKPSYDPNLFVSGINPAQYKALVDDRDKPLFNRAINGQYAPGSTFKLAVGLAALAGGVVDWEEEIVDRGSFRLPGGKRVWRDWSWKKDNSGGQGIVNLNRAIYRSSNVFFYHLGTRLSIDHLAGFAGQLGYGRVTSVDVADASAGLMPDPVWKLGARGEHWYPGDNVNLSIGQGDLLATPLQVATVAMVIANRGHWRRPRLLLSSDGPLADIDSPLPLPAVEGVTAEDWEALVDAMEDVVHRGNKGYRQNGTAWAHIGMDIDYRMAGKSGTAQVVEIPQGEEYDEDLLDEYSRKHAWFMAFAPADDPQIAVGVLVENGGGGSSVAAPVAKEVIDAFLLAESPQILAQR